MYIIPTPIHKVTEMKKCSTCNEMKPLAEYSVVKRRGKPYTLARCRACKRAYQKEYLDKNPAKRKEFGNSNAAEIARMQYKASEKGRETARKHREANKDVINAKRREAEAKKRLKRAEG